MVHVHLCSELCFLVVADCRQVSGGAMQGLQTSQAVQCKPPPPHSRM